MGNSGRKNIPETYGNAAQFPKPSSNIQTVNAGFTAAGPSGYYLYLKLQGLKLTPDVVVVGLYLGNDIISRRDIEWLQTDEYGLPGIIRSETSYVDINGNLRNTTIPIPYRIPILRNSHLFIYLTHALFGRAPTQTEEDHSANFVNTLICQFKEACHDLDSEKEEVMTLLKAMKKISNDAGSQFLVALIPTDFQIHADSWLKYRLPFPLLHKDREFPNNQIAKWLTEAGIEYIDLLPTFIDHEGEQTYFTLDDHWNPRGHEIAAEAISRLLLPLIKQ